MKSNLTPAEYHVIVEKGTEKPYTGEYNDNKSAGTYTCRQCGAALYRSESKFESGCGWPSFDDELVGAIIHTPDADGRRTEITCKACGGHLGHVFVGEQLTPKNTRHCVNSISMRFTPDSATQTAVFAGGCFWGVEHLLQQQLGVLTVQSGYTGGQTKSPTYEQVCSGTTGHFEAVEVRFDPTKVSYEELTKLFFEIHDPTQVDGQGPDKGQQYHSAIFFSSPEQQAVADSLTQLLKSKGLNIATCILPLTKFYPAEAYHQDYYQRKGSEPYCHARVKRF
ncbi:MAG: bifunctional methionine sulfoxide reductase B/A protein [Mucinivorans sp.]